MNPSSKKFVLIVGLIVVAAAAGAGAYYFHQQTGISTEPEQVTAIPETAPTLGVETAVPPHGIVALYDNTPVYEKPGDAKSAVVTILNSCDVANHIAFVVLKQEGVPISWEKVTFKEKTGWVHPDKLGYYSDQLFMAFETFSDSTSTEPSAKVAEGFKVAVMGDEKEKVGMGQEFLKACLKNPDATIRERAQSILNQANAPAPASEEQAQ